MEPTYTIGVDWARSGGAGRILVWPDGWVTVLFEEEDMGREWVWPDECVTLAVEEEDMSKREWVVVSQGESEVARFEIDGDPARRRETIASAEAAVCAALAASSGLRGWRVAVESEPEHRSLTLAGEELRGHEEYVDRVVAQGRDALLALAEGAVRSCARQPKERVLGELDLMSRIVVRLLGATPTEPGVEV